VRCCVRQAARGKTADVEGLENAVATMSSARERRARLQALSGGGGASTQGGGGGGGARALPALVLCSGSSCLGYVRMGGQHRPRCTRVQTLDADATQPLTRARVLVLPHV
jgi:hypothetical protein